MGLLAMRLLQFSWFTIERCSMVEAGMARGCSPWGVASITHIVCDRHRRRRGAGLLLASLAQPRPKILTPKSLPGSMRATTPSVVIWAPVTPSARDSSSKDGASARAVSSLGRYDYRGTLFGGGSDLSTTFDGEARQGRASGSSGRRRAGSRSLAARFLSVDASYTAFQQYWSLAPAGYRLGPRFALGLESGALGKRGV